MNSMPRLVITTGEPAGIGPEVTLKALSNLNNTATFSSQTSRHCAITLLGDFDWLQYINQKANTQLSLRKILREHIEKDDFAGTADSTNAVPNNNVIDVIHLPTQEKPQLGQLNTNNASYVIDMLSTANNLALHQQVDAIVTAPVHKGVINDAGISFTGHTEYFADATQTKKVVMMLASDKMKVALATTHLPLRRVAEEITQPLLEQVLFVCVDGLQQLGYQNPNIKVLGLNPHAGEGGHLGTEEIDVIEPLINRLENLNANINGPYSGDTVFSPENLSNTDLFLAMYHDQGLPVIKYSSFGKSANVTLGLPYIRTSVDHGTALEIADKFTASSSSMTYAILFAMNAVTQKHQQK